MAEFFVVLIVSYIFAPYFGIGYVLALLTIGRKSLAAACVLAALASAYFVYHYSFEGGTGANYFFAFIAYGLVLGCAIRTLSLIYNIEPWSYSFNAMATAGLWTLPMIVGGNFAYSSWIGREPDQACLHVFSSVEVAGTRYLLPNIPFITTSAYRESSEVDTKRRIREVCARAITTDTNKVDGFSIKLVHYSDRRPFEVTKKTCASLSRRPRWIREICGANSAESFAATQLPLKLEVSKAGRSHTLTDKLAPSPRRQYESVKSTINFDIYRNDNMSFWIERGGAEPRAFACEDRKRGKMLQPTLACRARYAIGGALIAYEFEARIGAEESSFMGVGSRVQEILTELTPAS